MNINGVGGTGGIGSMNMSGLDLETALMMVQSKRTELLETQLKGQIEEVQARNDRIAKYNDVLAGLNAYAAQIDGDKQTSKPKNWPAEKIRQFELPLNDAIREAGITDLGWKSGQGQRTPGPGESADTKAGGKLITGTNVVRGDRTKGDIDAAIQRVKGMIDAESNSQQMDMLRLQSLSNKRNEAFDLMTNFVKKMQDSRSSIVNNMR